MTRRPQAHRASPQEYRDPAVGGRRKAIEETVGGVFVLSLIVVCLYAAALILAASVPGPVR